MGIGRRKFVTDGGFAMLSAASSGGRVRWPHPVGSAERDARFTEARRSRDYYRQRGAVTWEVDHFSHSW